MNALLKQQILISLQVTMAVVIAALAYWFAPGWFAAPTDTSASGRIEFLAPWLLIPALAVFGCTLVTMLVRFFSDNAIDGTRRPQSRFLEINLRITQNTLEQAFLAVLAWLGLAMTLAPSRLVLIPVLAILFGLGRVFFWVGYHISPKARAFGFGLTLFPTAVALGWLTWTYLTQ